MFVSKSKSSENQTLYWNQSVTDQLEEIFPEVLGHQSEQSQKSPTKCVVAGVTVVWISPSLQTDVTLRADPEHIIFIIIITISNTDDIIILMYVCTRGSWKLTQRQSCYRTAEHRVDLADNSSSLPGGQVDRQTDRQTDRKTETLELTRP